MRLTCRTAQRSLDCSLRGYVAPGTPLRPRPGTTLRRRGTSWLQVSRAGRGWYDYTDCVGITCTRGARSGCVGALSSTCCVGVHSRSISIASKDVAGSGGRP
jgi:hypothetical protein